MYTAEHYIETLQLLPHPEGGYYKEIYRADLVIPKTALTYQHLGDRSAMTSIYYLLQHGDFSALHRIASDELWHHYDGGPLTVYEITTDGDLVQHVLQRGNPFAVIKAGSWFGCRVETPGSYTLCGCTVAPGFDFADFEMGTRSGLLHEYPEHEAIITGLTRC
jgi:predicted cupin superfamily sugar epimerase